MKHLSIPTWIKAQPDFVWVEYPLCSATPENRIPEFYRVAAVVELKIMQGKN